MLRFSILAIVFLLGSCSTQSNGVPRAQIWLEREEFFRIDGVSADVELYSTNAHVTVLNKSDSDICLSAVFWLDGKLYYDAFLLRTIDGVVEYFGPVATVTSGEVVRWGRGEARSIDVNLRDYYEIEASDAIIEARYAVPFYQC